LTIHWQDRLAGLQNKIARLEAALQRLSVVDHRFFLVRVGLTVAGLLGLITAFLLRSNWLAGAVIAGFILLFIVVLVLHRRVQHRLRQFRLLRAFHHSQLARMQLDWNALPTPKTASVDHSHPFAADLDLLGSRSLHHLLDISASQGGSDRLAAWLLQPVPDPLEIERRQSLLHELAPLSGFRSRLALYGMDIRAEQGGVWESDRLLAWLSAAQPKGRRVPLLVFMFSLAALNIILFVLHTLGVLPPYWIATLVVYALIYFSRNRDTSDLFEETYTIGKGLEQFGQILVYLERYPCTAGSGLTRLCAPFKQAGQRPSADLRRLAWFTVASSLGNNPVLALLINLVIPWNLLIAFLLGRYKIELRGRLEKWLETWFELEALLSLANFAYLNPAAAFPQVLHNVSPDGQPVLHAVALGHPLLPPETRVCNDIRLHALGEVALITGSNMAGKSTFLRTLGINLVLAFAGGPVIATALVTVPFRLFTSIQISDSLGDGISYFYAEVRRLKALLDALQAGHPYPVFFLIDEIFRGTNNLERRAGSRAYLRALAGDSGVGAVSTHDLALAELADEKPGILNYHFREEVHGGQMVFDYLLRPGPSPTTNALTIMRLAGLPVDEVEMEDSS
jgi:hypothetical protein